MATRYESNVSPSNEGEEVVQLALMASLPLSDIELDSDDKVCIEYTLEDYIAYLKEFMHDLFII